jgi:hypothetical protein
MKIINRIFEYIEFKGIKPTRFEKNLGFSNGYLGTQLKRNADLGESVLNKIINYCLDINIEWLITGNGEMLKKSEVLEQRNDAANDNLKLFFERYESLNEKIGALNKKIWELESENKHLKDELSVRKKTIDLDIETEGIGIG